MRRALAVFAKSPLPGRVKTRLSPPLTIDEAAQVAWICLEETVRHALGGERSDLRRGRSIQDEIPARALGIGERVPHGLLQADPGCLLYTSDAADD